MSTKNTHNPYFIRTYYIKLKEYISNMLWTFACLLATLEIGAGMGDSREGRREGRKEGIGREGKQGRPPMDPWWQWGDFFNSPGGKTKTNKTKAILKKCKILGTCLCSSPEATPLSPLALRFSILRKLQGPCQSQNGWQGGRELTLHGYSFLTLP